MNLKNLMTASVIALFTLPATAGDILFIDINNVIPEIKVVENYLKTAQANNLEKNTRLVVVPSYKTFPLQKRQELEKLSARLEKALTANNYNELAPLGEKIRELKTGDKTREYTMAQLVSELQSVVQNPNYKFDRIFISGHHSPTIDGKDGVLGGEFLNGFSAAIAQSVLNSAASTRNANSLILLGCYTGTPGMMGQSSSPWASVVPNAAFHFGYNNPAPIKSDSVNLAILQKIISAQNLIAHDYVQSGQVGPETLGALAQYMKTIKTQGRYLGYRVGNKYLQHPVKN